MIIEFVAHGDLFGLLHPKKKDPNDPDARGTIDEKDFPWEYRMRIALDIAKGMHYLQSITPPIIHRDLRSPNIFVCLFLLFTLCFSLFFLD
jgi:serine/threonine protein kinase